LTQIDFVSTPRTSSEFAGQSDDEDFEELQPKKRRKKASDDKRSDSQPSLTQWDRVTSTTRKRKSALDEDGFEIWEDRPPESTAARVCQGQLERAASALESEGLVEHGQKSRSKHERPPSPAVIAAKAERQAKLDAKTLRTPRKATFLEIPSSQSPLSGKLSTQRSVRFRDAERSPLKERSVNAGIRSPSKQSPGSQPTTMKMLQKVHLEDLARRKSALPVTNAPPISLVGTPEQKTTGASDEPRTQRTLKRTTTVQDSQYEDLDLDEHDFEVDESDHVDNDEDEVNHDQSTFDPAYSALDRDAIRFLQTQMPTQAHHLTPHVSNSTCAEEEITLSDEELDDTIVPLGNDHSDDSAKQLSSELQDAIPGSRSTADEPHRHNNTAVNTEGVTVSLVIPDSNNLEQLEVAALVTSSPPPLRPSQVSTVMSTQLSVQRPLTRDGPVTIPTSPQHETFGSLAWPPETLSSSPLPLPPWSSPYTRRIDDGSGTERRHGGELLAMDESLVDFSLPPPPPMSSSSRVPSSPP